MYLLSPRDGCIIKLVGLFKACHDGYYSCRDPKDLLERLDQMESKGLKYFSLNIPHNSSIHHSRVFGFIVDSLQIIHESFPLFPILSL